MSNYYSNDIINSPIINKNIDCSIPCNIFLYFMSSCPTKTISYFPPSSNDLMEIFMILLSLTPYPTVFLLLCLAAYFHTSRSVLILIMVFIENFTVISLKSIIGEPRPNYLCNAEYGYPSNHSCFFTCILFWFIAEEIWTPEFYQCKYKSYLIPFGIIYPFILYSRYYLNYHSLGQIFGGFILGIIIGIGWFLLNTKFILCNDNILKQLMTKFCIENNLTNDILYQDDEYVLLDEYQSLIKKENELIGMKQKLKNVSKNIKNFEGLDDLNENFKEILTNDINNNENEKGINNNDNDNENDSNDNNENEDENENQNENDNENENEKENENENENKKDNNEDDDNNEDEETPDDNELYGDELNSDENDD